MASLHHLPSSSAPAYVAAHLRDHGYAIVDDLVPSEVLDRFSDEIAPFLEAVNGGRDDYNGRYTRRVGALIARSPAARELVMNPLVVDTVKAFLHHVTAVQLHLTQLISIGPSESAQKLHRDQMAFDFFPFANDYHVQCNTMWALTDFTAENGATHIVAGSSTWPDDQPVSHADSIQAEMRRGSILFYDGKVLHGGGANRSAGDRQGINITYSVGWVRQEENQFVAVPPHVARGLDDDLLKMMGYQQGAFALGYVGDLQDPLSALRGEFKDAMVIGELEQKHDDHRTFLDDLDRLESEQAADDR